MEECRSELEAAAKGDKGGTRPEDVEGASVGMMKNGRGFHKVGLVV